ncbi:MAG: hypothetical protein QME76_12540 [Bacillota bacterium]|nr:hypothetical protein [Bacillota bacterium]
MMQVRGHAIERWVERIAPEQSDESDAFITRQIIDTFGRAKLIYTEAGEDGETEFWLAEDIVLVVIAKSVVTVFKADWGFGEDINRIVAERLVAKLLDLRDRRSKVAERIGRETVEIDRQLEEVRDDTERLNAEMERLKAKARKLRHYKDELEKQLVALDREIETVAKRLVYSVAYRLEWARKKAFKEERSNA